MRNRIIELSASLSLLAIVFAASAQTTTPSPSVTGNSATQPVLKSPGEMKMHLQFLALAKKGNIDLLFIGDSITDFWRRADRGKAVWDQYFAPSTPPTSALAAIALSTSSGGSTTANWTVFPPKSS